MQCDQFIVKHFAGCVAYNVSGFLNKNNDSLQVNYAPQAFFVLTDGVSGDVLKRTALRAVKS